jgi:hypothetical protein
MNLLCLFFFALLLAIPAYAAEPVEDNEPYTNRLIHEKSPYLLQHAHNPVDWYPWGKEAFAKAHKENKPIFLSVGYSTCHWCHVMERESFENPKIAAFMNEHFVNIKMDREERPDIDSVYMTFLQATTGSGGWPMSIWLTPDLKPFGRNFFPVLSWHSSTMRQVAAFSPNRPRSMAASNPSMEKQPLIFAKISPATCRRQILQCSLKNLQLLGEEKQNRQIFIPLCFQA